MNDDRIALLERLAKLRENGDLSQEEFDAEKARLLDAATQSFSPEPNIPPSTATAGASVSRPTNGWLIAGIGALGFAVVALVILSMWKTSGQERSIIGDKDRTATVAAPSVPAGTTVEEASPAQPGQLNTAASSPSVPPKIVGEWRTYRTRIREGWGTEPDFAGRYIIIRMGCGGGCTFGIVGDHQTGELYDLGLGGEEQMYLNLDYGVGSNVINARWDDYQNCFSQGFSWTGTKLTPLGEPQISPRGDEPCDMSY